VGVCTHPLAPVRELQAPLQASCPMAVGAPRMECPSHSMSRSAVGVTRVRLKHWRRREPSPRLVMPVEQVIEANPWTSTKSRGVPPRGLLELRHCARLVTVLG
jgi:hypothetical protein